VKPRVLMPWVVAPDRLPAELPVAVYDGVGDPPAAADLTEVELYVMPYGRPGARDVIRSLPSLRVVQLLTAGYDNVLPVLPATVELHNGTGLHDASTAEHALALILAAQRELPRWANDQRERRWRPEYTRSLADSRVLIVGYGNIGRAIEARLLPFETTVTKVARRARPAAGVHSVEELPELIPAADIVVLVLPHTSQTQGLFGPAEFALMPDDALIVNVGRGPAIDTAALLAQNGRIRAALDVVEPEPLPAEHPLWRAPGVFLTPHIAGGSATFVPRAHRFVEEQVRRWALGQPLANLVEID